MKNAYKLLVAFLPQSSTGSADSALLDASYKNLTFGTSNYIPLDYEITNINRGGSTVATRETGSITDLDLWSRFESGKISQGEITFALNRGIDVASILSRLEAIAVPNNLLGALKIGRLNETATASAQTGTRVYDTVFTTAAYFGEEGALSGNAKDVITSTLKFRPTGRPTEGKTANGNQTMTLTVATNAVVLS